LSSRNEKNPINFDQSVATDIGLPIQITESRSIKCIEVQRTPELAIAFSPQQRHNQKDLGRRKEKPWATLPSETQASTPETNLSEDVAGPQTLSRGAQQV